MPTEHAQHTGETAADRCAGTHRRRWFSRAASRSAGPRDGKRSPIRPGGTTLLLSPGVQYVTKRWVLQGVVQKRSLCDGVQNGRDLSLGEYLRRGLAQAPGVGDRLRVGNVELMVQEHNGSTITRVGIDLAPPPQPFHRVGFFRSAWRRLAAMVDLRQRNG